MRRFDWLMLVFWLFALAFVAACWLALIEAVIDVSR